MGFQEVGSVAQYHREAAKEYFIYSAPIDTKMQRGERVLLVLDLIGSISYLN